MSLSAPALPDLIGDAEARPADFRARYRRGRTGLRGAAVRASHAHRRRNGTLAAAMLAAVALPAFASPGGWERFTIGSAGRDTVQVDPMPFEQPGSSFPGSAFYYLEADKVVLGKGILADGPNARTASGSILDPGPAASALHVLDIPFSSTPTDRSRALQCLTSAIYYEAASEPDAGQRAVAQVVLNRVAHPTYPNTVCGVVYEGSQRSTGCQFSFTCDGSLARKPQAYFWKRAEGVAREALSGQVYAPVGLATHYHTLQVHPYWAPSLKTLTSIGAHRFYSFEGPAGRPSTFHFLYTGGEPDISHAGRIASQLRDEADTDPVAIQNAYAKIGATLEAQALVEASARAQIGKSGGSPAAQRADASAPANDTLPENSRIREEYRNSGRWLKQP